MAKSLSLVLSHKSLLSLRPNLILTFSLLPKPHSTTTFFPLSSPTFFSTTSTPYPLQYDLVINRPTKSSLTRPRRRLAPDDPPPESPEGTPNDVELGFDDWVDRKLSKANRPRSSKSDLDDSKGKFQLTESAPRDLPESDSVENSVNDIELGYQDRLRPSKEGLDKSKRKYYNKRIKRMYGSDSDDEFKKHEDGYVELQPEVVEFHRLHKREEELYFYDTFAYPWEKDKHYKMVYQLEKKYFPDHCLDKAFLEPGDPVNVNASDESAREEKRKRKKEKSGEVDKRLVFFEEKKEVVKKDVMEKKVEDFFKSLKKVRNKNGSDNANVNVMSGEEGEPYVLKRGSELPPRWDGSFGTMVLINKPKGWTSFTVCGKLRRLVKVKKVGHAGTLDPMATGLLIVCVGKATKLVDRYQGMIKGYSGVFRLGEATSTWDADSPVIQREPWEHIKDADIKKAAASFLGEIWQVPPMFSAIKVNGEKMYEKARRGESIELAPRRISIFKFEIERSLEDRQNLIFRVTCSKGTYIRSLCADFGKALGSCAHLTALRRDSIGEYSADDAWDFKDLEDAITKGYF